ncbi:MAG: ABC transporter permease [Carbonactinosporaceae bacterium]
MVAAQALLETRLLLRNGEQVLLLIVIPSLLLVVLTLVPLVDLGPGPRIDALMPGLVAFAVMATAFTGQAIATGYERRYGALKLLGATPLPRWGLLAGKTGSVLAVEASQVALLAAIAAALGWAPRGSPVAVAVLLVAGTAAFSGLGLLMAGTLRAEATLAAANLVFVLLLIFGGVVAPLERFPAALRPVLEVLPTAALSGGLQTVLESGGALPWGSVGILAVWAVVAGSAATATFRWE